VNLGVAKDQRLSLNPAQISGACGRLMCCLRYEHEFYVQSRKRFPKETKVLVTARGEEKVVSNDIFNERVTLRNVEGEIRIVSLVDLKREMAGGAMTVEEPVVEDEPDMMLELDEEVIRMTDTAERPAYRPGLRPGMPGFPAAKDRPVPLQRREPPPRESFSADPPEFTGEYRIAETRQADATAPTVDASPAGPVEEKSTDASGAPSAADASETPRSPRRRRGRRGGRRGRGRTDSGSVPPNVIGADGTAAPSTATESDDGDEGDDA
jgi:hypothetical protein